MPPPARPLQYRHKLNIDLSLVPPSRYSVFVKGLPRNASPEDVRDEFSKECGHCSILFQKYRPNGVFLVLRFEKAEDAKKAISRFDGWKFHGEFRLSVDCYKDVLKYHLQQKQQASVHQDASWKDSWEPREDRFSPPPPPVGPFQRQHPDHFDGFHDNSYHDNSVDEDHHFSPREHRWYGSSAVNRAKRWYQYPTASRGRISTHRPYNRLYDQHRHSRSVLNKSRCRSHDRSRDRSDNRCDSRRESSDRSSVHSRNGSQKGSRDTSCSNSHDTSRENSREKSRDGSNERSQSDARLRKRLCNTSREYSSRRPRLWSKGRRYDKSREISSARNGSYWAGRSRRHERSSYERSRVRSLDRADKIVHGKWQDTSRDSSQERSPGLHQRSSRSRSKSQSLDDEIGIDEVSKGRPSKYPQESENRIKSDVSSPEREDPRAIGSQEVNKPQKQSDTESACDLEPECDLEPGEIESGSSPDPEGDKMDVPHAPPPGAQPSIKLGPMGVRGVGLKRPVGTYMARTSRYLGPPKPRSTTLQKESSYDAGRSCWIEVGKMACRGSRSLKQKPQFRKILMGKHMEKPQKSSFDEAIEEKEQQEVVAFTKAASPNLDIPNTKEESSSNRDSGTTEDVHMRNLEEACIMSLHSSSTTKFKREILEPRAMENQTGKSSMIPERATLSDLEQVCTDEMDQLGSEAGHYMSEVKSLGMTTPKKSPQMAKEGTPTKDERYDSSDSSSSVKPFFLRFVPHRLNYQSPLAVFSTSEEPRNEHIPKKNIYLPPDIEKVPTEVHSRLTSLEKSFKRNTSLPFDNRADLEFVDTELEKSFEEKSCDRNGTRKGTKDRKSRSHSADVPKELSLVPYDIADTSYHSQASKSTDTAFPDSDSEAQQGQEAVTHSEDRRSSKSRKSRISKRKKNASSIFSSKKDTSMDTSNTELAMDSSSSFSSPTKPSRSGGTGNRSGHGSKRNRSLNSSVLSTSTPPSSPRSESPIVSRSKSELEESPGHQSTDIHNLKEPQRASTSPNLKESPQRSRSTSTNRPPSPCTPRKPRSRSTSPSSSHHRSRKRLRSPRNLRSDSSSSPTKSPNNRERKRQRSRDRSRSVSPVSAADRSSEFFLSPSRGISIRRREIVTSTPTKSDRDSGVNTTPSKSDSESSSPMKKAISRGQMQRVLQKKRELEAAFKSDCDAICCVTKVLLSKDPSLEEQLCNSAKETLSELGTKFVSRLKAYIDSLA